MFLLTRRYRLGVRTRGSQPRDRGSNPRTGTILRSSRIPHSQFPELVNNDPILWAMLNAIQEQQEEIQDLQRRLAALKAALGGRQWFPQRGV